MASRSCYRCCRRGQTKILVISNSGGTCLSQVCIALSVQLSLTLQESSSNTHDTITVRLDLKVSLHTHGADCRQKSRMVGGSLTSIHNGGAILVITNAEEDSAARPSDPRIPNADASPSVHASTLPRFLSFKVKSCVCKDVYRQRIATNGQWLRTHSSVCPSDRVRGGARGRFHIARCTAATADDLDCLVLVFHGEKPATAGTAKACGFRLQVLHHQRGTSVCVLGDHQTVFFTSRRNHREASRKLFWCSDGILVLTALMWLSCHCLL